MGKLYVVGIGPGGLDYMTVKSRDLINSCDVVVGYDRYIEFISPLLLGKEIYSTGMRGEEERCIKAIELSKDRDVVVISTGDPGIYGMAGLLYELGGQNIQVIPGVTASSAAASQVGAPLMHDHCSISLSDLMIPYETIKKRVRLAAEGDFVISLYNPKSTGRVCYLRECIEIIKPYRKASTPIAAVKNALRDGQQVWLYDFNNFSDKYVDMFSIVIVGNSESYIKNGKFITPRGY